MYERGWSPGEGAAYAPVPPRSSGHYYSYHQSKPYHHHSQQNTTSGTNGQEVSAATTGESMSSLSLADDGSNDEGEHQVCFEAYGLPLLVALNFLLQGFCRYLPCLLHRSQSIPMTLMVVQGSSTATSPSDRASTASKEEARASHVSTTAVQETGPSEDEPSKEGTKESEEDREKEVGDELESSKTEEEDGEEAGDGSESQRQTPAASPPSKSTNGGSDSKSAPQEDNITTRGSSSNNHHHHHNSNKDAQYMIIGSSARFYDRRRNNYNSHNSAPNYHTQANSQHYHQHQYMPHSTSPYAMQNRTSRMVPQQQPQVSTTLCGAYKEGITVILSPFLPCLMQMMVLDPSNPSSTTYPGTAPEYTYQPYYPPAVANPNGNNYTYMPPQRVSTVPASFYRYLEDNTRKEAPPT